MGEQKVTKFDRKHYRGKGNQLHINEGDGHPGTRGTGPNWGNKGISLKDYSSRTAEQNATKFGYEASLGEGESIWINKGGGLQGTLLLNDFEHFVIKD